MLIKLLSILNVCIKLARTPYSLQKSLRTVLIYKKGIALEIKNYRPIALIPSSSIPLFASFKMFIASIASYAPMFFVQPNWVGSIMFFISSTVHILVRILFYHI
jgi:hypothetical protein